MHGGLGYERFGTTWLRIKQPKIRAEERHLYEIFPHGRPCKPYLDLDGETLPHPCRHRWRRRQTHRGPLHAHLPR
eukprot:jgi/Tetstr1/456665/TSEL_043366.t1